MASRKPWLNESMGKEGSFLYVHGLSYPIYCLLGNKCFIRILMLTLLSCLLYLFVLNKGQIVVIGIAWNNRDTPTGYLKKEMNERVKNIKKIFF